MMILGWLALLAILCYLIGRAADLVIISVKTLGKNFGVQDFWLGLVLGLLTSTPELTVGIQAQIAGVGELSFGNLTGGVVVLLGLVCGLSIALQREIDVSKDFRTSELVVIACYIALPLTLASDGVLSSYDGLLLIALYAAVAFMLMERHRRHGGLVLRRTSSNFKAIAKLIGGLVLILLLARLALATALELAQSAHLSLFLVGLLIVSIGTNLPEITLAFRAWRSHARDLSLGNIIGSAFANGFVLGILSQLRPIAFVRTPSYITLAIATVVILVSFVWYAATGRRLTRREGITLLACYVVFVAVSFALR